MNFLKKYKVVHFLAVFLFLVIVTGVIVFSQKTKASSSTFNMSQANCNMSGSVSLNKDSYSPYETITASAIATMTSSNGASCSGGILAKNPIDGSQKYIIQNLSSGTSLGQNQTFTAAANGTNYISFIISGSAGSQTLNVYYSVNIPNTPSVSVWVTNPSAINSATPVTTINHGSSVVVHWSSSSSATSCGMSKYETGNGATTYMPGTSGTSGVKNDTPTQNDVTYKVTCSSGGGTPGTGITNLKVIPTVNVTSSSGTAPSTISWTSSGATTCKNVNANTTVSTSGSFLANPATPTPYYIRCSEASQVVNGSCSGSYLNTSSGSCSGTVQGSICSGGGSPWEGDDCSDFNSQSSCPGTTDPWCRHGCSWTPPSSSTVPCAGLGQTSCVSHSTGTPHCTWAAGTTVEGDSAEDSTMVVLAAGKSVNFYFKENNLDTYTVPYNGSAMLAWGTENLSSSTTCDLSSSNGSLIPSDPLVGLPKNNPGGIPTGSRQSNTIYSLDCHEVSPDSANLIVTGNNLPDLIVTSLTPTSATPGQSVSFTATVKNNGSVSTGSTFYNLFQTSIGLDDAGSPLGVMDFKASPPMTILGPGESKTQAKVVPLGMDVKLVRACADKSGRTDITGLIDEGANENNNCSSWFSIVPMPNLKAGIPVITSTGRTREFTLQSTVSNAGNSGTVSEFDNFFQMTDTDPNSSGGSGSMFLTKNTKKTFFSRIFPSVSAAGTPWSYDLTVAPQMSAIAISGSSIAQMDYTFPTVGMYWVRACSDKTNRSTTSSTDYVNESSEGDNCSAWVSFVSDGSTITGSCSNPDTHYNCSSGSSINQAGDNSESTAWTWDCQGSTGTSPDHCSENKPQTMTGTLTPRQPSCLISAGNSSCNIEFDWVVNNPVVLNGSGVFYPNPNPPPAGLRAGTGDTGTRKPFPVKYDSETFFLYNYGQELDREKVTSSCDTGTSWNGTICSGSSDLTAENITPVFIKKGQSVNIYATIVNQGGASTADAFWNLFQKADDVNGSGAGVLKESAKIGPLDANTNQRISVNHTFDTVGDVFIRACADKNSAGDGTITEDKEDNNCSAWTLVHIYDSTLEGKCSNPPIHYGCMTPASATNRVAGTPSGTPYTWVCPGSGGGGPVSCSEPWDNCSNGAINYPNCDICGDGTVPNPTCTESKCSNGATNYPACNLCSDGTTPNPTCMVCKNGATNYPTCTTDENGKCVNKQSNPPICKKKPGYIER